MTPRYPADPKFRRHGNRSLQGMARAGLAVALLMAGGLSWSWWQGKKSQSPAAPVIATATTVPPVPVPPPAPAKSKTAPVAETAPVKPMSLLDLAMARDPAKPAAVKPPVVAETREPQEKLSEKKEPVEKKESKKAVAETAKAEQAVKEDPQDNVDLTFYRSLQERRVVLPQMVATRTDTGQDKKATVNEGVGKPPLIKPAPLAMTNPSVMPATRSMAVAPPVPAAGIPWNLNVQDKAAESRPDPAPPSSGRVMVQVLVDPEFEKAAAMASRLQRHGINAHVFRGVVQGATVFRVHAGPFASREEATSKSTILKSAGGSTVILPDSSG